ncbi:MAG: T9SS type A sorting domain-containing protein [candidate division Zixibacteria bacterium]|nr:T9SS type A sorting domain-containing protein [candidate division Zixibacteria bacterium]
MPAFAGWSEPVRISEPGGCWYPQIATQGDTIHVVYTNTYGGDKISYIRSIDEGETWSEHIVLSDTTNTDVTSYPRIINHGSNIIILWKNIFIDGVLNVNIGYSVSQDGGFTWDGPDYVFSYNVEHIYHQAAANSGQTINVVYSDYSVEDPIFRHVRSTNFGQSWSDPETLFIAAETGQIDMVAYEDNIHCVWYGNFNDGDIWETYYTKSLNGGLNWSENIALVDVDDYGSIWPSLSVNDSGDIIFCWTDFKYTPNWWTADLFVKYGNDSGEEWSEEEQISFSHLDACPDVYWLNDTMHVVWERGNVTSRNIYYMRSVDNGLTWEEEQCLENDPDDSKRPSVAASNEKVHVIWADDRDDPDTTIGGGIYYSRWESDVSIEDDYLIPSNTEILTSYPNPFNSSTVISYSNIEGGDIEIYDLCGRHLRTLNGGCQQDQGRIAWDATDASGEKVCSGVYFVKMSTSDNTYVTKLIYLR